MHSCSCLQYIPRVLINLIEDLILLVARKGFFFGLGLALMVAAFFNSSLIVGCLMFGVGLISVLYAISNGDIHD